MKIRVVDVSFDNRIIPAHYVVGADGARSTVRRPIVYNVVGFANPSCLTSKSINNLTQMVLADVRFAADHSTPSNQRTESRQIVSLSFVPLTLCSTKYQNFDNVTPVCSPCRLVHPGRHMPL